MKLIKSDVELIQQENGLEGLYKHIEKCGRTCYKSENNIKEGSAEKFVNAMINSKHGAMLEHGTVYLRVPYDTKRDYTIDGYSIYSADHVIPRIGVQYALNPYSKSIPNPATQTHEITTNLRVLVENGWLDDLKYMCEPGPLHEKRYTMRFICDRGVTHELVRHRTFSFAQESSRYCNYGSDKKFEKELTYICPSWIDYDKINFEMAAFENFEDMYEQVISKMIREDVYTEGIDQVAIDAANEWRQIYMLCHEMKVSEKMYMYLIEHGYKPQQARCVLPTMIKSEICMTGFESDWRFFFDLRLFGKTGEPHPDMLRVAEIAKEKFENAGYWDNIMKYDSKFE